MTAADLHTFDDLLRLDDRIIMRGLGRVNWNDLVYAYIGAGEQVQRKIKRGMSAHGARYLENLAAHWPPTDPAAVKATQARILEQYRAVLRALESRQAASG